MGILKVRDLSLTLNGKKLLDDITADFWEGHVHAIVGPNGAGKSTFAYTVMGLEGYQGAEGDIVFNGESLKGLKIDERAKKGITLGWQEPARYEGLTVERFIRSAAEDKSEEAVRNCLRRAGLEPDLYLKRAVDRTLSGGERKKVELASILAVKPKLVLLDEPDSGIDVASLKNIFRALKYLKDNGSTIILITHSLEVLKHAEHAFLMCHGRIIEKGDVEKIKERYGERCMPCPHKNLPELNGEA